MGGGEEPAGWSERVAVYPPAPRPAAAGPGAGAAQVGQEEVQAATLHADGVRAAA